MRATARYRGPDEIGNEHDTDDERDERYQLIGVIEQRGRKFNWHAVNVSFDRWPCAHRWAGVGATATAVGVPSSPFGLRAGRMRLRRRGLVTDFVVRS